MTLTEEQSFLQAIAAQPEADLPRLAYADWCDEHDDPFRAICIRNNSESHSLGWRHVAVCSECEGTNGFVYPAVGKTNICGFCWGGDLGGLLRLVTKAQGPAGRKPDTPIPVDWARGFPFRVHCKLEDVCWDFKGDYVPTSWALAVCCWHPVTEFRVDLPFNSDVSAHAWFKDTLPPFLFDLVQGHDGTTADAAHTAMARALGTWVRSFLKEPQ